MRILPAAFLALACGGAPRPEAEPPEFPPLDDPGAPTEAPAGGGDHLEEIPDRWWLSETDACPAGSALKGAAPPAGRKVECVRDDGKRHGRYTIFLPSGDPGIVGAYDDGELDGPWARLGDGGQPLERGRYRAGRKVGTWTQWHPGGAKNMEGAYVDGVEDGTFTFWDETGAVIEVRTYRRGQLVE